VGNRGEHGQACHGDSGGPLLIQTNGTWRLIGALSRIVGPVSCGKSKALIYNNLIYHSDWITRVTSGS
jgi:secreted trypsin-like serine protease